MLLWLEKFILIFVIDFGELKKIVDNFDFVRFFYLRYNLYELFNKNKKVNIL